MFYVEFTYKYDKISKDVFTGGFTMSFTAKEGVAVYLDETLKRFETVFPACGSSNSAIELTIEELEKYSGYQK